MTLTFMERWRLRRLLKLTSKTLAGLEKPLSQAQFPERVLLHYWKTELTEIKSTLADVNAEMRIGEFKANHARR